MASYDSHLEALKPVIAKRQQAELQRWLEGAPANVVRFWLTGDTSGRSVKLKALELGVQARIAEQERDLRRRIAEQERDLRRSTRAARRRAARRVRWLEHRPGDQDALDLRLPGSFESGKRQ